MKKPLQLLLSAMLITAMTFGADNAAIEEQATAGQETALAGNNKAYPAIQFPERLFEPDTSKDGSSGRESRLPKPAKRIEFGGGGGVSSTFGSFKPSGYNVNNNIGFNVGIWVRVYAFKNFYVQPGVHYYFTSYKFRRLSDDVSDKVITHSLRIPVLAGYTIVNSQMFFLRLSTGPAASFNLKVNDNDVGVTKSTFKRTYWEWVVQGQIRIAVVTVHGGFNAGISKYSGGSRQHSWYAGLGFSI